MFLLNVLFGILAKFIILFVNGELIIIFFFDNLEFVLIIFFFGFILEVDEVLLELFIIFLYFDFKLGDEEIFFISVLIFFLIIFVFVLNIVYIDWGDGLIVFFVFNCINLVVLIIDWFLIWIFNFVIYVLIFLMLLNLL